MKNVESLYQNNQGCVSPKLCICHDTEDSISLRIEKNHLPNNPRVNYLIKLSRVPTFEAVRGTKPADAALAFSDLDARPAWIYEITPYSHQ